MQLSSAGLLQAVIKGLSEHVGGGAAETVHENTQHMYKNAARMVITSSLVLRACVGVGQQWRT